MQDKMKALVIVKYGSPKKVLKLREIDKPTFKDDEALIRNSATSINTGDALLVGGKAPKAAFFGIRRILGFFLRLSFGGLRKPKHKIPGMGFAGEIVLIGKDVKNWNIGDHVYGFVYLGGAAAEYMAVPASVLARKPKNLSFQEAAAVPGGSSPALAAFRDGVTPQKDDKILIIGASGGIGTFAVQMAKHVYGAEVTGVCGPNNVDLVKKIGANFVIDYSNGDYTKKSNSKYKIIYDVVAVQSLSRCKNLLASDGIYISNNPINSPKSVFHMLTRNKRFKTRTADESAAAMETLREWIENGKVMPVIDKVYPLSQAAEAITHYESGHAKGRIVISIE
ncbi:MAG: NAD(P)-dependent alcohol dehydrogenase [Candidatus Hodarchaeales archaeon]|jgi:NADPH:quinone reductase-like Zn-dependent oxidoreductase